MDEELKAYLTEMEGRIMARFNDLSERMLNTMTGLRGDFVNAKGFLVSDAVVSGRRWLKLEEGVAKIEEQLRKR